MLQDFELCIKNHLANEESDINTDSELNNHHLLNYLQNQPSEFHKKENTFQL